LGFGKTKATDIFEAVFDYNGSVVNAPNEDAASVKSKEAMA